MSRKSEKGTKRNLLRDGTHSATGLVVVLVIVVRLLSLELLWLWGEVARSWRLVGPTQITPSALNLNNLIQLREVPRHESVGVDNLPS